MAFIDQAILAVQKGIQWSWNTSKAGTFAAAGGLTGGITLGAAGLGVSHMSGYHGHKLPGHLLNWGFEATEVLDSSHGEWAGASRFRSLGSQIDVTPGGAIRWAGWTPEAQSMLGTGWSWKRAKAHLPSNWLGLGVNAFAMYQGYQEGGMSGAYDAMALSGAVEASLFRWNYGVGNAYRPGSGIMKSNLKLAGHPLVSRTSSALFRGFGASAAGYVGQQIGLATGLPMAGTIGATVGAYIGGAPLQALKANPIVVGSTIAAVGAAAISYGAYSVVKSVGQMGYDHRQRFRGVNTDGDMASFMTQNALTMRERSVQAIAKSHLNARSALGQEANFMHSPRNYNSRYR